MKTYEITFIDENMNREFTYDNVLEVNFRHERVLIKCKENNEEIFVTYVSINEFNKIIIKEV